MIFVTSKLGFDYSQQSARPSSNKIKLLKIIIFCNKNVGFDDNNSQHHRIKPLASSKNTS